MPPSRLHGDVLVLGHSLEAALTAVLLVRRGWKVLWPGDPPPDTVKLGDFRVTTTSSLVPSAAASPALMRLLAETGLATDLQKRLRPAGFQHLGHRRRDDVPDDAWQVMRSTSEAIDAFHAKPLRLGIWSSRSYAAARRKAAAALAHPKNDVGEAITQLSALDVAPDAFGSLRIGAGPHELAGGVATLVQAAWRRFVELGGTPVNVPMQKPLESLDLGWSLVRAVFSDGSELSGRALLLGLDDAERGLLIPPELPVSAKLSKKLGGDGAPLRRKTWIVRKRGVPKLLATNAAATLNGHSVLLERHGLDATTDEISATWRASEGDATRELETRMPVVREVLPFFEQHVVAASEITSVRGGARFETPLPWRVTRRCLVALPGVLGLSGLDDAAVLAESLADLAMRLAPRTDLVK